MPFKTAIKWIHRLVTLSLVILVAGFLWLNHQPDNRDSDELQRAYKLSDHVWLYMTINSSGGATVPTLYRYYLSSEIHGEDVDVLHQLKTITPFLEGTGSITSASVEKNGEVTISYSGNVFSLRDEVSNLRFTVKP
ncbi:hypothetical protein F153LOC_15630 [Lelliottia sp. F153]|uniref:hypothetical protein n=1 Tax=unclassified Lelliottia TaxID=2642424 RepID=UPI000C7F3E67|nr:MULTISPECIES: hypothetical protein [unclassified Lelliottia]PLY44135.1 hypothetical protein F159LOC_15965 [Lelliottia sp. F159]PLY49339.1 hypothetical protein F154LOC_16805 [Lelliottia sp. F154]PLY53682.1 hypothetical protein F153LOC_15630 [Lelliottia sp. F153]